VSLPNHIRLALAGRTILQVVPELDAGGAERTTVDVAAALAEAGARALVATEGGRLVGELQAKGGEWLPFPAASKNPGRMAANAVKLARVAKARGVDVIHARSRAPAWSALGAARALGVPFLTTYHGAYNGTSAPKVLYNSVMARGDVVIANSQYTAGLIRAAHPFASDRIRVIPRGTDLSAFTPSAVGSQRVSVLRDLWDIGPHERIVLLAARLTGWKGQRILIDAAKVLESQGLRDVVFVLAGDPQGRDGYVAELDGKIEGLGLAKTIRRVGHVTDMPAAMVASAAITVPSTEPEAFGRVAVEAQAIGTPVIVSNLGAVPETVLAPPDVGPDQRTGWRVPASDPVALADAIGQALALRPSARDQLAVRARQHVETHFSLRQMLESTLDVYASLITNRAPR
jgi:glycosyltransferase involved in cell wall biosynthesis